jgi:hypothetical protein
MRRVPPLPDAGLYADALRRFVAAGDIVQENLAIFGTNTDDTTNAGVTVKADTTANPNVTASTLIGD